MERRSFLKRLWKGGGRDGWEGEKLKKGFKKKWKRGAKPKGRTWVVGVQDGSGDIRRWWKKMEKRTEGFGEKIIKKRKVAKKKAVGFFLFGKKKMRQIKDFFSFFNKKKGKSGEKIPSPFILVVIFVKKKV